MDEELDAKSGLYQSIYDKFLDTSRLTAQHNGMVSTVFSISCRVIFGNA
jgi:hypothetical protein